MSYETNDKMVSHPDHYKSGKYEVIDIIDEFCKDLTGTEAVCTANAIKYILRWKKKNGVQDLKKAVWYLTHMIDRFADAECEDHAKFDDERLDCEAYHMEDYTSGGTMDIHNWEKAALASQGFKKIVIHHMNGQPNTVIDISNLDGPSTEPEKKCGNCKYFDIKTAGPETGINYCKYCGCVIRDSFATCDSFEYRVRPTIDDEPEPLNLRKNAAGVYIPQDKSTSEKIKNQLDGSKFGMVSAPDDFMNPPYKELMKQCEEYKKAYEDLKDLNDVAIANIKILEDDVYNLSGENDAILEDYKTTLKTISNRLSVGSPYGKKEVREWIDKKLEDIKNDRT